MVLQFYRGHVNGYGLFRDANVFFHHFLRSIVFGSIGRVNEGCDCVHRSLFFRAFGDFHQALYFCVLTLFRYIARGHAQSDFLCRNVQVRYPSLPHSNYGVFLPNVQVNYSGARGWGYFFRIVLRSSLYSVDILPMRDIPRVPS